MAIFCQNLAYLISCYAVHVVARGLKFCTVMWVNALNDMVKPLKNTMKNIGSVSKKPTYFYPIFAKKYNMKNFLSQLLSIYKTAMPEILWHKKAYILVQGTSYFEPN